MPLADALAGGEPMPSEPNRPRLAYVDGLRGLCALYVLLYHAAGDVRPSGAFLRAAVQPYQFGRYAVAVFIVVSGFCLMLPVARSAQGAIPGGLRAFAVRRARRLLPAYFCVLIPAIIAVAIVRQGYVPAAGEEADVLRLSAGSVWSHLLLVHNLRRDWAQAFDPPMWSVAAEAQIYVLFPLLVMLWRRLGMRGLLPLVVAAGLAPHFLLPPQSNLDWTCPWYLGLFGFGMAAACARGILGIRALKRWPWGFGAALPAAIACAWIARNPYAPMGQLWLPDILLGAAAAAMLAGLYAAMGAASRGPIAAQGWRYVSSVLEHPAARRSGAISYSLYLLHAPVLWLFSGALTSLHVGGDTAIVLQLAIGAPVAVSCAYLFYLAIERPASQWRLAVVRPHG